MHPEGGKHLRLQTQVNFDPYKGKLTPGQSSLTWVSLIWVSIHHNIRNLRHDLLN